MSSASNCGTANLPVVNWNTESGGICPGSAQSPSQGGSYTAPLVQGSQLSLNGSTDLSQIIVGPNGACVQSITYEHFMGVARSSVIYVQGQGPEGAFSGTLELSFLTEAGQTHTLGLTSSSPSCHTDRFQDDSPIVLITWAHS